MTDAEPVQTGNCPYPSDVVEWYTDLIASEFAIAPDEARMVAIRAMEGADSHGCDPTDRGMLREVMDVVVRKWLSENPI